MRMNHLNDRPAVAQAKQVLVAGRAARRSADVLTLEGDRCSLGVVLVVDVGLPRRLDQLGELTFQPAQTLSCRGTLGGKPLSRTLRRDPRHGTNLCEPCLCVYA